MPERYCSSSPTAPLPSPSQAGALLHTTIACSMTPVTFLMFSLFTACCSGVFSDASYRAALDFGEGLSGGNFALGDSYDF